jgi:hypothetical protein
MAPREEEERRPRRATPYALFRRAMARGNVLSALAEIVRL